MPGEVKFTEYGVPYVVEFANVSIWPRQPTTSVPAPSERPLGRSNTMPLPRTQKSLPALPQPTRSASLKSSRTKSSRSTKAAEEPKNETSWLLCRRPASRPRAPDGHRHGKVFTESQETLVEPASKPSPLPEATSVAVPSITITPAEALPVLPSNDGITARSGGLHIAFPNPSLSTRKASGDAVLVAKRASRRLYRLSKTIADAVLAAGMDTRTTVAHKAGLDIADMASTPASGDSKDKGKADEKVLFRGTYGQVRAAFRLAGLVTRPCDEGGFADATRLGALFVANRDGQGAVVFTKIVMWGTP
ncbi:hypothetical protein OF83DRAFT_2254 [Amylostereum chailletii]|nr:hypothetical protein OF83DRAFT_2254 [Amylostereum chailletii]